VSMGTRKSPSAQYRRDKVGLRITACVKLKIIKTRTGCSFVLLLQQKPNLGRTKVLNGLHDADTGQLHHKCNRLRLRLLAICSITITNKQNHNVIDYDYIESNHDS